MQRFHLPWIRRRKRNDPELPLKPPIHVGALSNGEIFRGDTPRSERVKAEILRRAKQSLTAS
jgi:hypothetical protein